MKLKKLSEAAIALSITVVLLLLLTSPLWIGWMMEHEHNKTRYAVADVALQCYTGTMEKREVWSKLGIAIFCEKDGVKHGVWQAWDGGYMHIEGEYVDGNKHGIWKYFNAYGEQWGARTYASGKEISGLVNLLTADSVLLKKSERVLYLIKNAKQYRSYKVRLGASRLGHKGKSGNEHMPEGMYVLDSKNENSKGRKSIHVSYSDQQDRRPGTEAQAKPNAEFRIHGQPEGLGWAWQILGLWGWTEGRIAVNNQDMDEIWGLIENGTPMQVLL